MVVLAGFGAGLDARVSGTLAYVLRPVTPEVAGSSPVTRAILCFKKSNKIKYLDRSSGFDFPWIPKLGYKLDTNWDTKALSDVS